MAQTGGFSEILEPGLREIIGTRLGGRGSYAAQLLKVGSTNRNYEDYHYAAGMPIAVEKPEGDDIQAFDPISGNTKRVTQKTYGIALEITEELTTEDLYKGAGSPIAEAARGLADSLREVEEIEGHRFFNSEAFLTSSVPDFLRPLPDNSASISVYNTAHGPISGGESPAQSNRPSTDVDFTVTSFRDALTQFRRYRNDRNLRIPQVSYPSMLLVPPELQYDAKEVVNSMNRPDTANRVENVTKGEVTVMVDPYLDDTDAWFLLAPMHWLVWLWQWRPRMDSYDNRRARVAVFLAYMRFGRAAVHWLGTYGSQGG